MKPKRYVNHDVLERRRKEPCVVCRKKSPSDPSHIKARGSGGGDFEFNCVAMCRRHHVEWHSIGRNMFIKRYPVMRRWLEEQGWDLSDPFNWKHE